jgi:hypothetical protein
MSKSVFVSILLCAVAIAEVTVPLQKSAQEATSDEDAYYGGGTVTGTVTLLNHPTLGKTPGGGVSLAFQRTDCPKCVIVDRTDINGHYAVGLSKGRYKVIIRTGTHAGETQDILSPSQLRYVEVTSEGQKKQFDIDVLFPTR